jgi:hypothetical protein
MMQLSNLDADEERIKEELFLLLSFFILTFEFRSLSIKSVIVRNKSNFIELMKEFFENTEDDDSKNLMTALINKLNNIKIRLPSESKILINGKQKSETK